MSGLNASIITPAKVATANGAWKTILLLIAPSNHRLIVKRFNISFFGVDVAAVPAQVQLVRATTAGTTTSLTPVKDDPTDDETLQATAGYNATVEPTAGDIVASGQCHLQAGYVEIFSLGREKKIPGGQRLALRVYASAVVDCVATMEYEE